MPSISEDQQLYCKLAQLYHESVRDSYDTVAFEIFSPRDDVNLIIPSKKSMDDCLIGGTPLHIVCHKEKTSEALSVLLERGADFTATNKNRDTALHLAFYDVLPRYCENKETIASSKMGLVCSLLREQAYSGNSENPRSACGLSHFHIACAMGRVDAVQLFLSSGVSSNESVSVDSSIFPGYTPLHFAAKYGNHKIVKLLLEQGADVCAKDTKGLTPLHLVTERNLRLKNEKCRRYLYQLGILVEEYMREIEIIIDLLLKDDRVLKVDEAKFSKLHAACTLSDSSVAEIFIKYIDVNCSVSMNSPLCPGYTALHFAAHFNTQSVKLLLENGADIQAKDLQGLTPFDICLKKCNVEELGDILLTVPAFKNIFFSDNQTKLSDFILAVQSHSTLEVFFQSVPKDLYLPKSCPLWPGYYLSHLAVSFSTSNPVGGLFCSARTYFCSGGKTMIQDAHGRTPLHLAFYQQLEELVDLFFQRQLGLDDAIDSDGLSHLHIACQRGDESAVRTLLENGANANVVYKGRPLASGLNSGSTPLHLAVAAGKVEIVKMLLQHGADANASDIDGRTPIHCTLVLCPRDLSGAIGDLLLGSCDSKNIICSDTGLSHLHVACYTANATVVDCLLKLGADPNAVFLCKKNQESCICRASCFSGCTPLDLAVRQEHWEISELLLQHVANNINRQPDDVTPFYRMLEHSTLSLDVMARYLRTWLTSDARLRKHVEDDTGISLLHIACHLQDFDQIQSLLADSKKNVNAQVLSTSPISPVATPLHILIGSADHTSCSLERSAKLLLDCGADVTLLNDHGNTPLLCFSSDGIYRQGNTEISGGAIRLLLNYQADFSINPVNEEGISHFHLACMVGEYTVVEKFLQNGIDVNLPIDYQNAQMTFKTPLHVALKPLWYVEVDVESQIRTVDVLLKYGADINVQDESGSTSLHEVACMESPSEYLFKMLHRAGIDVHRKNLRRQTALEILAIKMDPFTSEQFLRLFAECNLLNTFSSMDGSGTISAILDRQPNDQIRNLVFEQIMQFANFLTIDKMGRTPIHNIVASYKDMLYTEFDFVHEDFSSYDDNYFTFIKRLMKIGHDIDAQDCTGKTALHTAAQFHNPKAVACLLMAGADINIADASNQTAFSQPVDFRFKKWGHVYNSFGLHGSADRYVRRMLALHLLTLTLCRLDVNSDDMELANRELSRNSEGQFHKLRIIREIETTKHVHIGTGSLTLGDFLSETGAIASRSLMFCESNREAIDKFFESIGVERFPELTGVLLLQYRKMLKRLSLMPAASDSLREVLWSVNGYFMPEICIPMIIRYLTNTEIRNLIASTTITKLI